MAIVIDVQLKRSTAMQAMDKISKSVDAVNRNVVALNANLAQTVALANSAASALRNATGGRGFSGGSRGSAGGLQKPPIDPFVRYVNNRLQNQAFRSQFNAMYGKKSNPLLNAVMSSRLGFSSNGGFSVMPLVSSLSKLGPIFSAVGATVIGVVGAWTAVIKTATEATEMWTQSMVRGGGSPGQAASAAALGNALGLGPNGLGDIGRNINPVAAGMAGVNPFGGPYGDNNYNAKGIAVAERINRLYSGQGERGFNNARREAEIDGHPDLANAALISREKFNKLKNLQGGSFENSSNMANLKASWEILSNKVQQIAVKYVTPMVKNAIKLVDLFTSIFEWLEKIYTGLPEWVKAFINPMGGGGKQGDRESAIEKNTKAVIDNTNEIRNQGQYGGGPRTGGASKMNPYVIDNGRVRQPAAYGIL